MLVTRTTLARAAKELRDEDPRVSAENVSALLTSDGSRDHEVTEAAYEAIDATFLGQIVPAPVVLTILAVGAWLERNDESVRAEDEAETTVEA